MPLSDRLAADTAVLTANINAMITAANVVVADTAAGASQPHIDTLAATVLAIAATRSRIVRMTDAP
jgi:hypothetical protein